MNLESQRPNVLVVEDDLLSSRVLTRQLESNGFESKAVASGEEALATVGEQLPSLIILDIGLPGIDGYETLRRLQSNGETARIPVIIVTARDGLSDWIHGYRSGAAYYLSKPYHEKQLLKGVGAALAPTPVSH